MVIRGSQGEINAGAWKMEKRKGKMGMPHPRISKVGHGLKPKKALRLELRDAECGRERGEFEWFFRANKFEAHSILPIAERIGVSNASGGGKMRVWKGDQNGVAGKPLSRRDNASAARADVFGECSFDAQFTARADK